MEQSQKPFKLPNLAELKVLTEDQLKPIFFELERHRASQVHDACEDCRERLERIQKEYDNDFRCWPTCWLKSGQELLENSLPYNGHNYYYDKQN